LSNADKRAVGFIPAQELAILTLELNSTSRALFTLDLAYFLSHPNQPLASDHHDH